MSAVVSKIQGRGIPLVLDDIDTDRIIPARYLRCVTFDGLGEFAFEDDRRQNPNHPFNQERFEGAKILIAGRNFGCGSSREHAPQSLNRWGIDGVIGESFAEIFFGNCQAMGIPCFTVSHQDAVALANAIEADPSVELTMEVASGTITAGDLSVQGNLASGPRSAFLEGTWNATSVLMDAGDAIEAVGQRLPYVGNFA
ncbi:MAG: 3-isopropylmalate/(R)-2-methylmalate dehydratase small subunit [Rhodothermales bacterium]|jgi:3-isopropylmalate/(R)-2-methylmalate dehydratase small subunit